MKRFLVLLPKYFLIAISLSTGIVAFDQIPGEKQDHPIVLIGGNLHTVSGKIIKAGEILFNNGVILEIGDKVEHPKNAEIINVTGKNIYPSFILAESTLGLSEISSVPGSRDHIELGQINPNVVAKTAYKADSDNIPVARTSGIAIAQIAPRGGLLSGTSSVMMLDAWTWEEAILEGGGGVWLNWPSMDITTAAANDKDAATLKKEIAKKIKALDDVFSEAEGYNLAKRNPSKKFKTDLRMESLLPIVAGGTPLYIRASHLGEIKSSINWAKRRGYKMVLVGALDSWMVTDLLRAENVSVIIQSVHSTFADPLHVRRWEPYDATFSLAAKLSEANITFTFSPSNLYISQNLPFAAGTAVAYGLPQDAAIRALTLDAARIIGVADRVGSLEPGKDATLIIVEGNPLEIRSKVEAMYIQGRSVDLTSKHTELRDKYEARYKQMGILP